MMNFVATIGRNDPCPCKSGKKFKKCCLPAHQALATQQRKTGVDAILSAEGVMPRRE
jgi:hypothetical protein